MKNEPREEGSDNQREGNDEQSNDIRRMFDHHRHEQTVQRLSQNDQPGEEREAFERIEESTRLIADERIAKDGKKIEQSAIGIEKDVLQMERFTVVFLQDPFVVDTSKATDQTIDGDHRNANRMNVHFRHDNRRSADLLRDKRRTFQGSCKPRRVIDDLSAVTCSLLTDTESQTSEKQQGQGEPLLFGEFVFDDQSIENRRGHDFEVRQDLIRGGIHVQLHMYSEIVVQKIEKTGYGIRQGLTKPRCCLQFHVVVTWIDRCGVEQGTAREQQLDEFKDEIHHRRREGNDTIVFAEMD